MALRRGSTNVILPAFLFLYLPQPWRPCCPGSARYPGRWGWFLEGLVGIYIIVGMADCLCPLGLFQQKTMQNTFLTKFVFLEIKISLNRMSQNKTSTTQGSISLKSGRSQEFPNPKGDTWESNTWELRLAFFPNSVSFLININLPQQLKQTKTKNNEKGF